MARCSVPCLCLVLVGLALLISPTTCDETTTTTTTTAPAVSSAPFGIDIAGWYPLEVTDAALPSRGSQLISPSQHRCVASAAGAGAAAAQETDAMEPGTGLSLHCVHDGVFASVAQPVVWNTLIAPGLYDTETLLTQRTAALAGTATVSPTLRCAAFFCDDPDPSSSASATGNLTGGLSPATPCCAARGNNTFLIRTAPANVMIQANSLPFNTLSDSADALVRAAWCPPADDNSSPNSASSGSSSSSSGEESNCTASTGLCLVRLLDPRFYYAQTVASAWNGDGGVSFPIDVNICGASLSDMLDLSTFELISRGLNAVITTTEHADSISLPTELIRGVLSWIAQYNSKGEKQDSALDNSEHCVWVEDPDDASAYRTGEFVECFLTAAHVGALPPLMLSVPRDRLLSSGLADFQHLVSLCSFALDLNQLVNTTTRRMRLYSTGSFSDAIRDSGNMLHYREPLVAIGAMFLRGATLGLSRATRVDATNMSSSDTTTTTSAPTRDIETAWLGLPMLYIAAYTPGSSADIVTSACVASQAPTCILEDRYFASMNRCVAVRCIGVIGYYFDSNGLTCGPSSVFMALFGFFLVATAAVEIAFLCVHRHTEKSKYEHVDLVEQAQRKKKN